ncbi:hypothetical protein D0809_08810 [Flavobacterium circumlabens]|uniref:DUF3888 domain-containing protein n=1 Tax=Flavobacterium circumlabens TaxID=2133765 RepID=A0A4Y7UFL7_9FLAO|nr:hypothetical protein [Flavobacterium circumlabens]TCN60018.1 hypothetical protein EV142_102638 [Flavobacterium circumlabens]TEB45255.1 hypothetical protein D0809_08810 [Flavobacterium circumlabens]
MKNILKISALIVLFINISCKAQQMVQTPNDVYKLKKNEQQFLNKPLKNLLKEIKPEIKSAFGTLSSVGYPSYFSFSFISSHELKQKKEGRKLIGLYVYVKEPVDEWDYGTRPKEIEFSWRKEDVEKYGNFTVVRIKVIERIED